MSPIDLPPAYVEGDVPQACIEHTAETYRIPPLLLLGILSVEGGRLGTVSRNTNGSSDYGPMQINSRWLRELAPYGITAKDLQWDGCVNMWVGGWILKQCLERFEGNFWRGVGCYNSSTTQPVDKNAKAALRYYRAVESLKATFDIQTGSAPAEKPPAPPLHRESGELGEAYAYEPAGGRD